MQYSPTQCSTACQTVENTLTLAARRVASEAKNAARALDGWRNAEKRKLDAEAAFFDLLKNATPEAASQSVRELGPILTME